MSLTSLFYLFIPLSLFWNFSITGLIIYFVYKYRQIRRSFNEALKQEVDKATKELSERNRALAATYGLYEVLLESLDFQEMTQKIADLIPQHLGYETGVVAIIDEKKGVLKRIALSRTSGGIAASEALEVPFHKIEIPLDCEENITIKVIKANRPMVTRSLYDILGPAISRENADLVQKMMGTTTSIINPLVAAGRVIGIFIVSMSKNQASLSEYEKEMISRFSRGVGVAIQDALLYQDLREIRDQLTQANKRLLELDKLKDEFISITSHELRTPMTAIKGYLWMVLNKKSKFNKKTEDYLNEAYQSTNRLINLVNDMLDVSRIESNRIELDLKPIDIVVLVERVYKELLSKIREKRIRFKINRGRSIPRVLADENKIVQVLTNLIGNSLKFTNDNGKITVKFVRKNAVVQVSVQDTGLGISREDQKKLFQKFSRVENSLVSIAETGGTGLGLYICKSLIDLHQGKIWVESVKGKGATFHFTLPVAKD